MSTDKDAPVEFQKLTPEQEAARGRRNVIIAVSILAFVTLVFFISMAQMKAGLLQGGGVTPTPQQRRRMTLTAGIAVATVLAMTGLAFAAVPLYDMFCKVTGYGGTTQTAVAAPSTVLERQIRVRFDSNVAAGLPIEFTPAATQMLHLGESGVAFYRVRNLSNEPVTAVASYNVAPHKVGIYFQKLECFCFQDQVIQPGEEQELPVVFYVDPALASNPETEEVDTVTLSYTFFRSTDEAAAALEQP